jgi:hypothetical protein
MSISKSVEPNEPTPMPEVIYVYEDTGPTEVRRISRHEAKIINDVGLVTNLIAPFLLKIEAAMHKNKTRPKDQP